MQTKRSLQPALVAAAFLLLAAISSGSIAFAATNSPPRAKHTHYRFTTIDIPGSIPNANGINDRGNLVSGYYTDSAGDYHGFLWHNGTVIASVDAPGDWTDTLLGAVDNAGVVIGNYGDETVSHATLYRLRDHTWTPLPDIDGKPINYGNGINNKGFAVGSVFTGTFTDSLNGVGWIWDGTAYSSFFKVPQASGFGTYASGINDQGQVVGYYQDSQGAYRGFLKHGSRITTFDVPGNNTFASAINDRDEVVGYYCRNCFLVATVNHGFIVHAGNVVTVDVPGAVSSGILGNNDRGDLVGFYVDTSGKVHGFIATRCNEH